jgi:fructose-1,6-bisphosphatase/inositol monophosphatase family enzyme
MRPYCTDDGFVGEEFGHHAGGSGRRWIADGIDGTRFFAAGALSLIVEEAGGRFTDHAGGTRLDTSAAIYSNGHCHSMLLDAPQAS